MNLEGEMREPVFEALHDLDDFGEFKLGSNTITWPNGADFSPEFLYAMARGWVADGDTFFRCRLPRGHEGPCEER